MMLTSQAGSSALQLEPIANVRCILREAFGLVGRTRMMPRAAVRRQALRPRPGRVHRRRRSLCRDPDLRSEPSAAGLRGPSRDARHSIPISTQAPARPKPGQQAVIFPAQTMLGLTPIAPRKILVVDPALPDWRPKLTLHDIQKGPARVSLSFRRSGTGDTDVKVLNAGGVSVLRPGRSRHPGDRVEAAVRAALDP